MAIFAKGPKPIEVGFHEADENATGGSTLQRVGVGGKHAEEL
jgi:hypothetical protein